jgi:spermidine/putrescine transport system permease protein
MTARVLNFPPPPWASIGPALALLFVFFALPCAVIAAYSLMEADPHGGVRPAFSPEAYIRFFFERDLDDTLVFDDSYLRIFARSFMLAAAATLLTLLIAFAPAYYIARCSPGARGVLLLLVTIPFWANLLVRTYCWVLLLRDTGLINSWLIAFDIIQSPLRLMYTDGAILLGLVYTYLPFMALPIYASLEKLDPRLLEAARDLYANRRQMLARVALPLAKPGIAAGCLLVFIPCLGAFIAPDLLGGGHKLMIGNLIQLQFSSSRNWPFGAAGALILLAFVLLLLFVYFRRAGGEIKKWH